MYKTTKTIKSISELTTKLIKDLADNKSPVWFRGQADESWRLQPNFLRLNNAPSEMNLIKKFKQSGTLLLDPKPNSLLDWLLIMQHHGMPTRLLDWSESPLVAAYFCVNQYLDRDGALWMLRPVELNRISGVEPDYEYDIPSMEDGFLQTYTPESLASERTSRLLPIAAIFPRNNQRMQAQQGVFTISHRHPSTIEEIGNKNHIWKYVIPANFKSNIQKELKILGFGKFQLFPELSSIGDF
jgi:hypothetical protein